MFLFFSLYFSDPSGSNFFFLSSLLLLQRSRIYAVTQVFSFWRCLPRISLAVSVTAVLKVVIIESCLVIVHGGERCKLTACHSLEGFQHIGIFQLFEVKLESRVFWFADSLQTKVEGHHQQVVVTSSVCSWKKIVFWQCSLKLWNYRVNWSFCTYACPCGQAFLSCNKWWADAMFASGSASLPWCWNEPS